MICQNCGMKNATSHIHSVVNGVVNDKYLCPECAAKYKAADFGENDIFKMLSALFRDGDAPRKSTVRCDCCGADIEEISRTGRVGCGNCYKTFAKELAPTLIRIHGRTTHLGKRPDTAETAELAPEEKKSADTHEDIIEKMKKELAEAVKNEEYEKAALLRDKIRKEEEEEK